MINPIPYKDQLDIDGVSIIPKEAVYQMYRKLKGEVVRFKGVLYQVDKVLLSVSEEYINVHLIKIK